MADKTDKDQIEELYRTYWDYMISKDIDGLDHIMTDDYELRHMTGLRQPKLNFFESVRNEELNYYSVEHDEIAIKINPDGETATMVGKSRVVAAVYGGGKGSWRLQGDFTLRKEAGVWKLASSRASTY